MAKLYAGPRHNDHFLAEAIRGTEHWDEYMTNLLTKVDSKSNTIDLSRQTIQRDVPRYSAANSRGNWNDPAEYRRLVMDALTGV